MNQTQTQTKMDEDNLQIAIGDLILKTHGLTHDDVTDEFMEELDQTAFKILELCRNNL